jgi:hypothetical protein
MQRQGPDFILHRLFVDNMMHTPTSWKAETLSEGFLNHRPRRRGLMETFLGMEIEQPGKLIQLHFDRLQEIT